MIHIENFDFELPEELIAQQPLQKRDECRLMHIQTTKKTITHHKFLDLTTLLTPNDVLVLNDTKVLKARFITKKETGGKVELFLVNQLSENQFEVLLKPSNKVKEKSCLIVNENLQFYIKSKNNETGIHIAEIQAAIPSEEAIHKHGQIPLPPYIKVTNPNQLESEYQTTFASITGSVAAPTAGLHFTEELLKDIENKGIKILKITHHVGYGTFKPIKDTNIEQHKMHSETYVISSETAKELNDAKEANKRLIAVGTTVSRALESSFKQTKFTEGKSDTNLFIKPGYTFKAIDGLISNFHLPKSTLIILVSTLAGIDLIKEAYLVAISERYRFYSFGDAMLISK